MTDGKLFIDNIGARLSGTAKDRKSAVLNRIGSASQLINRNSSLIPELGKVSGKKAIAQFQEKATAVNATTVEIDGYEQLPNSLSDYLRNHNLSTKVKISPDKRFVNLNWHDAGIEVQTGGAVCEDDTGLSHAVAGVAETGTLAFFCDHENPKSISYIPQNHIAIVHKSNIVGAYEQIWDMLRQIQVSEGWDESTPILSDKLPRSVDFITGPSRTGDIEQTIELGAHGPLNLHIVIVGK